MDVVAQVEAALASMANNGIVKSVHAGSAADYEGGLRPEGTPVKIGVIGDPDAHRDEIERLLHEAGIEIGGKGVRLFYRQWPT